jgi:hypothetical protein
MKKTSREDAILSIFALLIVGAGVVGYALNIVKLFTDDETKVRIILRVGGLFFAPLGAILGYV